MKHKTGRLIVGFLSLGFIFFVSFSLAQSQDFCPSAQESESQTISLDVKGMDIIDVLKILSEKGGFNLSISGDVKGRVTLFLKDIGVWEALEIVLISGNLAYETRGDIIYIMTDRDYELKHGKKYWDSREMGIFNLTHAQAGRVREILAQTASKIGKVFIDAPTNTVIAIDIPEKVEAMRSLVEEIDRPLATKVFSLNYLPAKELETKLADVLTKDAGMVRIDEASNKVIIVDYPANMLKIEQMVRAFDEKPMQVLIDALIVEIKPSKKFYAGINWDYWIKQYFRVAGTFSMPTTLTDQIKLGTIGLADPAKKGDYKGILEFLETFGETRILSSPRILALNNQEAKILVGTKDAYVTSSVSQIGDSAVESQTVNFVDVGVKLFVTPTINRQGYITMKIKPEISSAERETITTEDKETEIPIVTTSEAETTVIVGDGVSIIIGGLRKVTREKEQKQVPVLGSIPGLGGFFRSKKDEWSRNELVIILTPRIVSGAQSLEDEIGEKPGESEMLQEFYDSGYRAGTPPGNDPNYYEMPSPSKGNAPTQIKKKTQPQLQPHAQQLETKDYYNRVISRIRSVASGFPKGGYSHFDGQPARAKVRFSVGRDGRLLWDPQILSATPEPEVGLRAQEIVQRAAPFPPFPADKTADQETFEVTLVF